MQRVLWIVVALLMTGCQFEPDENSPEESPPPTTRDSSVSVWLEFRGVGDLTYTNSTGNTEQRSDRSPEGAWKTAAQFRAEPGEFLYLSIQNGLESGSVECRILVGDEVVESARSSGAFVIATCSGEA